MPEHLRDLLTAVADEIDPGAPPPALFARARRRAVRHRGVRVAGLCVLVVLAATVPFAVLHRGGPAPTPGPTPAATPIPVATSDAARIATWRWSGLPAAPIAARIDEAYAWTGTGMLVWGGATPDGEHPLADGAAYDPATRTWSTLPASPLSGRRAPAYAWTGTELFVWGGGVDGAQTAADGALYDPATRTWRPVAPAPISARAYATALWTGDRVVVIGGTGLTGPAGQALDAAAYDPATDRWQRLPDLPRQQDAMLTAVSAGDRIYAFAFWQSATGSEVRAGIDEWVLRPGARGWDRFRSPSDIAPTPPLWTGTSILVPAGQKWYGQVPGPDLQVGGRRQDSITGTWTALPAGPADQLRGESVWTGAAMVTLDTGTEITGPDRTVHPGQAAVWDPATDRWTSLPAAPHAGATAVVYTGDSILLWGPTVALALGP